MCVYEILNESFITNEGISVCVCVSTPTMQPIHLKVFKPGLEITAYVECWVWSPWSEGRSYYHHPWGHSGCDTTLGPYNINLPIVVFTFGHANVPMTTGTSLIIINQSLSTLWFSGFIYWPHCVGCCSSTAQVFQ